MKKKIYKFKIYKDFIGPRKIKVFKEKTEKYQYIINANTLTLQCLCNSKLLNTNRV